MALDENLLNIVKAAELMGVSRFTLRSWLRQGRLPYIRLSRRILLDRRDLEQYIDAHRVMARLEAR